MGMKGVVSRKTRGYKRVKEQMIINRVVLRVYHRMSRKPGGPINSYELRCGDSLSETKRSDWRNRGNRLIEPREANPRGIQDRSRKVRNVIGYEAQIDPRRRGDRIDVCKGVPQLT